MESYVVIHGNIPITARTIPEYVAHIVYGTPEVRAVKVGWTNKFVAICLFSAEQETWATGTFERIGSFNLGASFCYDREEAITQFGAWLFHYAETLPAPSPL